MNKIKSITGKDSYYNERDLIAILIKMGFLVYFFIIILSFQIKNFKLILRMLD